MFSGTKSIFSCVLSRFLVVVSGRLTLTPITPSWLELRCLCLHSWVTPVGAYVNWVPLPPFVVGVLLLVVWVYLVGPTVKSCTASPRKAITVPPGGPLFLCGSWWVCRESEGDAPSVPAGGDSAWSARSEKEQNKVHMSKPIRVSPHPPFKEITVWDCELLCFRSLCVPLLTQQMLRVQVREKQQPLALRRSLSVEKTGVQLETTMTHNTLWLPV